MLKSLKSTQLGYFDLFDRHTEAAKHAIHRLREVFDNLGGREVEQYVKRVEELEHECDTITHLTVDMLRKTFITPFERDEIRLLISTLDDIVDYAEATAHRITLYEIRTVPQTMLDLCDVLVKTQEEVQALVGMLRHIKDKKKKLEYQAHVAEINRLENEGDRLNRAGIAALFKDGLDALTVIKLKEVYEMLESAIDSCEDAAEVIEGIIIEHVG